MDRPSNVNFLTDRENECMEHLLQAQDIFDEICTESPQSVSDTFNFGHYVEAARNAILIRGARRRDPDNLLKKKSRISVLTPTMIEHARSTERHAGEVSYTEDGENGVAEK